MAIIRELLLDDLSQVISIIKKAVAAMELAGINQWDEKYPDQKTLHADIGSETMYGYEEGGKIIGIIVLNENQDTMYQSGKWKSTAGRILVIHRLCIDPSQQNKGIAKRLVLFAENFAIENGFTSIRLDAFAKNPAANKLYTNLNYSFAGRINLRKGEFLLYEKLFAGDSTLSS